MRWNKVKGAPLIVTKKHLKDGTFVSWLAIYYNEIIGTSGMSFVEKPPYYSNPNGKIGLISSMYTLKQYRRKGIAKELLKMTMCRQQL